MPKRLFRIVRVIQVVEMLDNAGADGDCDYSAGDKSMDEIKNSSGLQKEIVRYLRYSCH